MKNKLLTIGVLVAALLALGLVCLVGTHGQENKNRLSMTPLTTNWLGYVAFGKDDLLDRMGGLGPYPAADRETQIGLRSDGIVVWRKTPKRVD